MDSPAPSCLLTNTKSVDDRTIPVHILGLQVVEKAAPLAHHFQQSPARMVVFGVDLEMVRQIGDFFTQNCYLHLRRSCVGAMNSIGVDYFNLPLSGKRQSVLHANPRNKQSKRLPCSHGKIHHKCSLQGKAIGGIAQRKFRLRSLRMEKL